MFVEEHPKVVPYPQMLQLIASLDHRCLANRNHIRVDWWSGEHVGWKGFSMDASTFYPRRNGTLTIGSRCQVVPLVESKLPRRPT